MDGSVEFGLEGIPKNFDKSKPILLCEVIPGMSQHFMVIGQSNSIHHRFSNPFFMWTTPNIGNGEFADQEFNDTWLNKILPIVSSFSENISKKREGPGFDMRTHHAITNYKIIKRGKGYFFRIKVVWATFLMWHSFPRWEKLKAWNPKPPQLIGAVCEERDAKLIQGWLASG